MKKSSYLKYLNLSFQFFFIVLFFGIVGYFIDNYLFNNVSIFTLFIVFIVSAFIETGRITNILSNFLIDMKTFEFIFFKLILTLIFFPF